MIHRVLIAENAKKDLKRVPARVCDKLQAWTLAVVSFDLEEVRKIAGFHDEPPKGQRKGQTVDPS